MSVFIEYQLEDGPDFLIETEEHQRGGVTKASRDKVGNVIASVNQKFGNSFYGVRKSVILLRQQLEEL